MKPARLLSICLLLLAGFLNSSFAVTHYVSTNSPSPTSPYTNWETAARTIWEAVDQAASGDCVVVTNGEFASNLTVTNAITVKSVNGALYTVIRNGIDVSHAGAVVDGFTINNTASAPYRGAGIYFREGGVVQRCIITGNAASEGAGVYFGGCGILRDCLVVNNTASVCGSGYGGGAYCDHGGRIENCTFSGNVAAGYTGQYGDYGGLGGGVFFDGTGTVVNSIIWGNEATFEGNEFYDQNGESVFIDCCTRPLAPGVGNISDDPRFSGADVDDYRLCSASPCVDAAVYSDWMGGAVDLPGSPRMINGVADIGCYESGPLVVCVEINRNGTLPYEAVFQTHASGTNTTLLYYAWDFTRDGTVDVASADARIVTNTYNSLGWFDVLLIVSNAVGEVFTWSHDQLIHVVPFECFASPTGLHVFPYNSWVTAATNLQDTVNVGGVGTTVWVGEGSYNLSNTILVTNPVVMKAVVNGTAVLDGQNAVRCITVSQSNAVIDGLTITAGAAGEGAGVYCCGGGTVRNCTIVSNTAAKQYDYITGIGGVGGGIYVDGGVVQNCRISDNVAVDTACYGHSRGGGAICRNGAILENCVIDHNLADGACAHIHGYDICSPGLGGGVYIENTSVVQNCTIVDNRAARSDGGGVYGDPSALVINCVIWSNTLNNWTGGVAFFSASCSDPTPPGMGNIDIDPCLADFANRDYHLLSNSLCIDAGTNLTTVATDLDGIARPLDGNNDGVAAYDMGCYEFVHPTADSDADGLSDSNELFVWHTQVLVKDSDGDNTVDGDEVAAGTGPLSASSFFGMDPLSVIGSGQFLTWRTVFGKGYWIQRSMDLNSGVWSNLWNHPIYELDEYPEGTESFYDLNSASNGPAIYRIRLDQ